MANTIFITHKVTTSFALGTLGKTQPSKVINSNIIKHNLCYVPQHNNFGLFRVPSYTTTNKKMNMGVHVLGGTEPGPVDPSSSSPDHWKFWLVGTLFTILLSFSKGKWGPLLLFKEKVETRIKEAEKIAEEVEEVVEGVEKVAEDVAKYVPEGKLHDAAQFVEKVAQDIDNHAQQAQHALQKAEGLEKDFESLIESTTRLQEKSVTTTSSESNDQK